MDIQLTDVRFEDLSEIACRFQIGTHQGTSYPRKILVIQFAGTYRVGSSGNPDASFMFAMGNAAVEAFGPAAVILDMSQLSYEWGDMLDCVFDIGGHLRLPSSVIVGPQCREAIGTLCFGINSKEDACQHEEIFDTLEDAWQYVTNKLDEIEDQRT